MARGSTDLKAFSGAMVRLYCPDCRRFAQFRRQTLIDRFGDVTMPDLLKHLKPCERTDGIGSAPCQLVYWDRMAVERRRQAIEAMASKGGLPRGWKAD